MLSVRTEEHWGRRLRCYAQRPSSVWAALRECIDRNRTATAIVGKDVRLTYEALDALSGALAGGLRQLGVGTGDRVAVMLGNEPDAALVIVALARLGAVLVPIGTRLRQAEIEYVLGDCEPKAIIHNTQARLELPQGEFNAIPRIETGSCEWVRLLQDTPTTSADIDSDEHAPFAILYTSGTTGKPKGALITHFNVVHSCLHWHEVHQLQPGERSILCVPWTHIAGLCGVVLPLLLLGGTLSIIGDFSRREFLETAQRERITCVLMVPAMYALCLLEPDLADFNLTSLRVAAYGGAPMPEATAQRFAAVFPWLQMSNCYGATETTSPATISPPGSPAALTASIGRVVPCGEILVVDEAQRPLARGEVGELWIRGPMVIPRYWRNAEADAAAFADGFWKSGDVGWIDPEGNLFIADRKKDMIIRGGFKVYPAEVEAVITLLTGVVEAAVVARPDALLGETVVAFVRASDAMLSPERVQQWCSGRLADYKVPSCICVNDQPLPRNANGKIKKDVLRSQAASVPKLGAAGRKQ